MIKSFRLIEKTNESIPFMSAAKFLDLEAAGYTENEYLFSGTANIYGDDGNGNAVVLYADAPYTNRIIVRRPKDIKKSSGRVVIEIINSTSYMDHDRVWLLTYSHLMKEGDVYIGLTSKPITMKTLRKYDPKRYADLEWNNPRESIFPSRLLGNISGASFPETEDGLLWDMLTDLPEKIRNEGSVLDGIKADKIYLAGWSQSGGVMITYTNYFCKKRFEEGLSQVYDGMFAAGAVPAVAPALNQSECMDEYEGESKIKFSCVPYFDMHTESENAFLGSARARIDDSDEPNLKYRFYTVAGSTHDARSTMRDYYKDDFSDQDKVGVFFVYPGREPYPNDFPYGMAFRAGLQSLYDWVEKEIDPPVVSDIPVNEDLTNLKDENGNAVGGWRLPEIQLPVCTYQQFSTPLVKSETGTLYGCEIPFSAEKLKEMYEDTNKYRAKVEVCTDQAVLNRLLLPEDRDECIEHAVAKAEKYGLKDEG